jgi:S1-C subfamily serine protease
MMSPNSSLAFGVALWLTLAISPVGLQAALTPEKLYQKVLPSVMSLEVENQGGERFVGSAVLARADDVALTTWHVVADARSVWAVFADGQRVKVIGCIDHDSGRDVALLKLERGLPHRQAVLCGDMQSIASRAYVIGAPKGYDFSISDGLISQIRSVDGFSQYQLSCPISPGNSGSPVFNQRGEVIGIAAWTKADAQNVNFAIPTQAFSRLMVSKPPLTWDQLRDRAKINSVFMARRFWSMARRERGAYPASGSVRSEPRSQRPKDQARNAEVTFARSPSAVPIRPRTRL